MLQQVMIVLVECISSSLEPISRLGCSCIRHIVLSCGNKLSGELWDILVLSLHRASQVFLLDSQRSEVASVEENQDVEDRSFIFLLYTSNSDKKTSDGEETSPARVPFRSLVIGLLANQMILQILGHILVKGSPHVIPSLANVLLQASDFSSTNDEHEEIDGKLPGMMKFLSHEQVLILLDSLCLSYQASLEFDRRPGLKFLIQKVSQSERASNLYKQAGASWTLRLISLFDLILSKIKNGLDMNKIKAVLDVENRERNTSKNNSDSNNCQLPTRPTSLLESDTQKYINMLSKTFSELCEAYLELVSNRANKDDLFDTVDDQPIFFLTIPADEFPTSHRKGLEKWAKSLEEFNKDYMQPNITIDDDGNIIKITKEADDTNCSSSLPSKMILGAVYSIATERDISALVGDYRRRKNRHSLPPSQTSGTQRLNPFVIDSSQQLQQQSFRPSESVPPEIEDQRNKSLMKDSEAHLKVWTEMVVTVFDLISQLKDGELRPLLPLVFPTMRSLTAHAHDPHLRQVVAELLDRVACLYGFSPAE
ncbi:Brefeldin A-inhibited guanine nucleotide-exchange protein 3 [Armadillidium vulgare]|nr:Brefeldin A-inhibited guanine nucleotide-exchange protein 3 [Armadillidium vulgare]